MTSTSLQFRPRLLPTVAMLCLLTLFVYLGLWQYHKSERLAAELTQHAERGQLPPVVVSSALVDPQELVDARIVVRGRYEAAGQFFLDNRQHHDQPGVHVITPLRIEGGATRILINRGWIGWGASRQNLPEVPVPAGEVDVVGIAAIPSTKKFLLMPQHDEASSKLWARIDIARFTEMTRQPVQPLVLQMQTQTLPEVGPALVREWPAPPDKLAMHRGYAFQWACIALGLLVFYGVASTRRVKR